VKRSLITIVLFAALTSHLIGAADLEASPFQSVVARPDAIIAALPAGKRWLVKTGSSALRLSAPGESFKLPAGSSLHLSERHSSYHVTAQLLPAAGLRIESTFDARSFGGTVTKKSYFIPAR
jgi:hypothetical protein